MRRADRLFQIVQFLRSRRLTTAQWLAERLEVSVRTIYRDIQDLSLSGVPIEGEAGVGYVLRHTMDLPPLMFDRDEIEAMVIGARMVQAWADPALQRAAQSALAKIHGVLPASLRDELNGNRLFAPSGRPFANHWIGTFRQAIRERRKLWLTYRSESEAITQRCIWPLGLFFWGQVWTLSTWCELRGDFRNFRIDRVIDLNPQDEHYPLEPGKRLEDFLAQYVDPATFAPAFKS
ncbi:MULTISPECIES: helix-turn-helix transcriptional regulator [Pseudomonas]|uniref:Predicted DNA-binding transcriptional regulator YafY, contains an HTH and WYL domains n=1 Tax=Pseudomonas indica TaxID=137658 RepID=A0A1G8SBE3_9PSED|nr:MULTISPECIES: YafY family protein [Pseudomonas]MBU3056299.1 YafY family transcriptional regulator [Pseudomonas indica]PAU60422.1 DNA-binding transcriptional regulator [Pseudomonas indica]PAU62953.1 DNA-binding transcriptional regulator [Pseudomonas sp. PIC25]SDJ26542.1 Predicted DNA-binding transcriptional regulator YafY, contains an HTH and WYL domains [Pseudomonas indica]